MIQSVARQPELRGELTGIQWLGFALTEAVVFYGLLGSLLATSSSDAPPSDTCRLLARDHAAPEPTLRLTKVFRPWLVGVRTLAWCSRPRNSAASLEGH